MARAGAPGSTWAAKNTIRLRMNSVIRPRPRRLRMNVAMVGSAGGLCRLVGVLEVDGGDRGRIHAVHAGGGGAQPVDEVRDDQRCLVQQQRLDLAGDRLLGLEVDSR